MNLIKINNYKKFKIISHQKQLEAKSQYLFIFFGTLTYAAHLCTSPKVCQIHKCASFGAHFNAYILIWYFQII